MAKAERTIAKCEKFVDGVLARKLKEAEDLIGLIDDTTSLEDIRDFLEEANSLISFFCGDDFESYEKWRYRLIIDDKGKYHIFNGQEIDVDPDAQFFGNDEDS